LAVFETDLLVAGAGMGGMAAAARAAQLGARVTVVEKGPQLGGSAVLSGGYLWTAESYELLREYNPLGDPGLGRVLIDEFAAATEWARGTGAWFSEPMRGNLGYGHGARFDVYDFIARCAAIVESAGGSIVLSCQLRELIAGPDGVTGALVTDRDGETEIRAGAVVLATGGWQGSPLLREKYLGRGAGALRLRANPYSTGDALEAALAVGAGTTERMDPFYGHLVAHPIEHFEPGDYLRLSQIWCYYGVLLDLTGRRFTDESIGYHTCAQDLLGRPGARGLLVADEELRRQYIAPPLNTGLEAIDRLAEARGEGAHVVSAPTIEELAASVAGWGYDEANVIRALRDYNGAIGAGTEPPDGVARKRYRISLTTGPFHAMEVTPAITFSHGGLRSDEHARVLNADGQPIPGLYAVGSDAAGAFCRGYAGGLANAAVFGLRAAADAVRSRRPAPAAES
jgi:succinate dehydrogenase/fumarate reductase flavoprotein subunit